MISDDFAHALLVERFGIVPEDEMHRPPLPLIPWTPDTPRELSARRRLLCTALDNIPQTFRRAA